MWCNTRDIQVSEENKRFKELGRQFMLDIAAEINNYIREQEKASKKKISKKKSLAEKSRKVR